MHTPQQARGQGGNDSNESKPEPIPYLKPNPSWRRIQVSISLAEGPAGDMIMVNDAPCRQGLQLEPGDTINFAGHRFRLEPPMAQMVASPSSGRAPLETVSESDCNSESNHDKEIEIKSWERRIAELKKRHEAGEKAIQTLQDQEDAKKKELQRLRSEAQNQHDSLVQVESRRATLRELEREAKSKNEALMEHYTTETARLKREEEESKVSFPLLFATVQFIFDDMGELCCEFVHLT